MFLEAVILGLITPSLGLRREEYDWRLAWMIRPGPGQPIGSDQPLPPGLASTACRPFSDIFDRPAVNIRTASAIRPVPYYELEALLRVLHPE
jgi:hypothetical protein